MGKSKALPLSRFTIETLSMPDVMAVLGPVSLNNESDAVGTAAASPGCRSTGGAVGVGPGVSVGATVPPLASGANVRFESSSPPPHAARAARTTVNASNREKRPNLIEETLNSECTTNARNFQSQ